MFENMNQIVLDVSEDEAPVPLQRAINSLSSINENTYIKFIHRMRPCMLFDVLEKGGYSYEIDDSGEQFIVYIYKK
jgi:hypothetical protein